MGHYLPELGLISSLFSKDLMIPSRWHFLRKVCSSDLLHHPGPARATGKWGVGEEGGPYGHFFRGRREAKQDSLPPSPPLCSTECPIESTLGMTGCKQRFGHTSPWAPLPGPLCSCLQCANLLHVIGLLSVSGLSYLTTSRLTLGRFSLIWGGSLFFSYWRKDSSLM